MVIPKEEQTPVEFAEERGPSTMAMEEEAEQQPPSVVTYETTKEEKIPVHLRKAQLPINLAETYRKLADIEMETTVNEILCETQTESV